MKYLKKLARLYCEQYEVDSSEIRFHGICVLSDCDDLCCYFILSTVNDYGVSIYNVFKCSGRTIEQIPPVFGHSFEGAIKLFMPCSFECLEDCRLFGEAYAVFRLENGKLL